MRWRNVYIYKYGFRDLREKFERILAEFSLTLFLTLDEVLCVMQWIFFFSSGDSTFNIFAGRRLYL